MAGPVDVRVVGLNKAIRQLQNAGVSISDLKSSFKKASTVVANEAAERVNTRSGDLVASIRTGTAKNKAIVRAGSARVPYAGVINYGGYNNITATEFLTGAATNKRDETVTLIQAEIEQIISRYGLN